MRKDLKQRAFGITLSALILSSSFLAGSLIARNDGINATAEETSVSETTAPTETTAPEETTAPPETSETAETSETEETSVTEESEETENSDIELLSLGDGKITQEDGLPTESGTYTLDENITVNGWTIPSGANIRLDLNGHNIDATGGQINVSGGAVLNIFGSGTIIRNGSGNMTCIKINSGGTVTLNGNVEITIGGTENNYAINNDGGQVTINDNVIINHTSQFGGSISNSNEATLTINGCNIGSGAGNYNTIIANNSKVTINGGIIHSKLSKCINVTNNSRIEVHGGELSGCDEGIYLTDNSTLIMDGGTLTAAGRAINSQKSTVTFGGTAEIKPRDNKDNCGIMSENSNITITGGVIGAQTGVFIGSGTANIKDTVIYSPGEYTEKPTNGYGISCGSSANVSIENSTICGTNGGSDGSVKADDSSGSVFVQGHVNVDNEGNVSLNGSCTVTKADSSEVGLPQGGTLNRKSGTITADELKVGDLTVKGKDSTLGTDGSINIFDGGSVQKDGGPEVNLPKGGTIPEGGDIQTKEAQIGGTTVTSEGIIQFNGDGSIKVGEDDHVHIGDNDVLLPNGGTVSAGGTVTAPKAQIGDTVVTSGSGNVTFDANGNVEVQSGDTVQMGGTEVTLPQGGTVGGDGSITVPDNGSVKMGDTEVTLPKGGTVDTSGTVTADELQIGDVTVKGEDVTVDKDGNITVPGSGTVQKGTSPEISIPKGGKVDTDGKVTADEIVVDGKTVTGKGATVDKDGNITLPNGGKVQNEDGSLTEISSGDNGTGTKISNGDVSVEYGEGVKFKNKIYDAILSGGFVSLAIDEIKDENIEKGDEYKSLESKENVDIKAAYDITLLYNGVTKVQPDGTVTVTIKVPKEIDGLKAEVFHKNSDDSFDKVDVTGRKSDTLTFKASSFSIYVIAMPVSTGGGSGGSSSGGSSSGGSSGNSSGSSYRPSYSVVTETSEKKETVLVKIENAVTGKKTLVNADKIDNVVTVDLGSKCNGYYANIYNENGDLIAVGVIKDNKVSFNFIGSGDISLIVDKVSYAEDISLGAGEFSSESEIGKDPAEKTAVCVSALFLAAAALLIAKRKHSK